MESTPVDKIHQNVILGFLGDQPLCEAHLIGALRMGGMIESTIFTTLGMLVEAGEVTRFLRINELSNQVERVVQKTIHL